MRRDSCRSVPMMCRPPIAATPSPSLMSTPRPAMLVVILRVEHVALDAAPSQEHREPFGFLDRARADQHRTALFVLGDDLVDDRFELRVLGAVKEVGLLLAPDGLVRGQDDELS